MAFADVVDTEVVHDRLNDEAREIRRNIRMREDPGSLDQYIRCWSEEDVIDGEPCQALVIILKTRGCAWALAGGCTMCGYANDSAWSKVSAEQLVTQFNAAWRRYKDEALVKIYTSGSFLDPKEVMPEARIAMLQTIAEHDTVRKVAFESLPGFCTDEAFEPLVGIVPKLEVGIGVESCNDLILRDSVNKGHGFDSFEEASSACHRHGVSVKSYLMCKPPFVKESDAVRDAAATITAVGKGADVISLNPTNIQGKTVVDALYKRGGYRPPWLWTLVVGLRDGFAGAKEHGFVGVIKSDVIAAGQQRGAHNCGQCDERVGGYLKRFKSTQDPKWLDKCLDEVQCPCRREWELVCALGPLIPAYGAL